jgi:protein-S-isoprenylcysteine O-methyltransferase Ste14
MKIGFNKNMTTKFKIRVISGVVYLIGLMFAVLIFSAGRLNYWHGWLYLLLWIYLCLFNFVIIPSDLLLERAKPRSGDKKWDQIIVYAFYLPLVYIIPFIAALDGGRYLWTSSFPLWINILAFIFIFLGYTLYIFSLWKNQFFSVMVHIQKEKGHYVVDKGPYSLIRHPGYAGYIISFLATGFAMNSLWALIPAGLLAIAFIIRTYLEDCTLKKELPGYKEYASRVRYRLFPLIW